jgi:hypothetical protein
VQTISQILQNALASSTKTASAPTPQQAPDADVVDMIFDKKASETPAPTSAPVEKKAQIEASDIALAAHGLKLARALEQASELVKEANLVVTATPTGGSISVPAATNNSVPAKYDEFWRKPNFVVKLMQIYCLHKLCLLSIFRMTEPGLLVK